MKNTMKKLLRSRRGMVGIEAAIVLIAFVIVAAAFSFMVVNMGLFSTQRGRDTIQQGVREASTPLTLDGSITVRTDGGAGKVDAMIIPLKTMGTKYVAMWKNETVVSLRVANNAWANTYQGIAINTTAGGIQLDPTNKTYTQVITEIQNSVTGTGAVLVIENSNGDEALQHYEKGYLIVLLESGKEAQARDDVTVEIRPEKGAPLTVELVVPEALPTESYITVG